MLPYVFKGEDDEKRARYEEVKEIAKGQNISVIINLLVGKSRENRWNKKLRNWPA